MAGIHCFNVESAAELELLDAVAGRLGRVAPVSFRVNPDVDPKTHPYIATGLRRSKFGIPWAEARAAYRDAAARPNLRVLGLDFHIGSQLCDTAPLLEAADRALELVDALAADGIALEHLDVGGGLGIRYRDEAPPDPDAYARALVAKLGSRRLRVITEPGRVLIGNAAVLLTRCLLTKNNGETDFVVVDAGMNDAIRPALYGAWHDLEPVGPPSPTRRVVDVVGPVCETGDFFARDRDLPALAAGDLVAMRGAGAYGFAMSSSYNSRPRAAEVLVDGDRFVIIRDREHVADLLRGERRLPPDPPAP